MNAINHRRKVPLLRAALMGTVALGLLAACGDETEVSEAPAVVEEKTAVVEPAEPIAPAAPAIESPAVEQQQAAAPEADVTVIEPKSDANVVVVEPAEPAGGSGASGTAMGSGASEQVASLGQPLDPADFAGNAPNAIGVEFRDTSGAAIGEVGDVLLAEDDTPEALVVILSENDRPVRVPLDQVRVRPGERELMAAGDAEQIRGLPTFEYTGEENAVVGEGGPGGGAPQ